MCLRSDVVNGAAMPEAAVDEDCQAVAREDDVCGSSKLSNRSAVDEVPSSLRVEQSTDG